MKMGKVWLKFPPQLLYKPIQTMYVFQLRFQSMQVCSTTLSYGDKRKKVQKDHSIQEICLERTYREKVSVISRLKPI